jgi:hypothetical protein
MRKFLLLICLVALTALSAAAQETEDDECATDALASIRTLTASTTLDAVEALRQIRAAADEALETCNPLPEDVTMIDTSETHFERDMGCALVFDISRGTADLRVLITGEARDDIFVDVYLPDEDEPLDVLGQIDKQFIDSEDLYIQQYYSSSSGWPLGIYRILLEFGGETRHLAFDMEREGEHNIYVYCEEPGGD